MNDLKFAFRQLRKNPGFTTVAVLTLALGIGANTAIFSVVNAVLLRPLPYPASEELVQVGRSFTGRNEVSDLSEPKFVYVHDHSRFFEAVTATQGMGSTLYLSDESQTEFIDGVRVTADFFRVLGVQPARGRGFRPEEDSPSGERVVILCDGLLRRRFGGDAAIIGRTILLNGVAHTVVGLMPPGFEYFGPKDVLVPMRVNPASQNEGHNWTVVGRLKQGVTPDQARAELQLLFDNFRATSPTLAQPNETFGVMNWRSRMTSSVQGLLWILLGVVGFLLVIACANMANLQLTRATGRQKELAIRMALGAGGARLLRQLLTEGVVLALLGGGTGVLLAVWGLKAMLALVPANMLPRAGEIDLDARVLAFALGVSVITGIIFSLAPALQTSRVDVNDALKEVNGKASAGVMPGSLRGALVVVEVALALILTIGAGLLLRTFANLRGVQPGFEAPHVLTCTIKLPEKNYDTVAKLNDFYRRALERLRGLPGVAAGALINKLPLDSWFNLPYRLAGQSQWTGSAEYRLISPDYFHVMRMSLRRGRTFDDTDKAGAEPVIIVNEAFARRNFAGVEPIDRQLSVGWDPTLRRVVGVVNDTEQRSLSEPAPAMVFIPVAQAEEGVREIVRDVSFLLRIDGNPSLLGTAIRNELRQIDPAVLIRVVRPLEQLIDRSISPQRFNSSLLSLFAGLGLMLAAVGIYSVMACIMVQRTREIGIRIALGAQRLDVLAMALWQGMKLAGVGIVIGLGGTLALTRLLKGLLFGVNPIDPFTFVAITLLLFGAALLACWLPARRASHVDPIEALRYE